MPTLVQVTQLPANGVVPITGAPIDYISIFFEWEQKVQAQTSILVGGAVKAKDKKKIQAALDTIARLRPELPGLLVQAKTKPGIAADTLKKFDTNFANIKKAALAFNVADTNKAVSAMIRLIGPLAGFYF